jgi:hypothetical protein
MYIAQSPRKCLNFKILAKIEGKEANFFSKIYQGHNLLQVADIVKKRWYSGN